MKKRRYHITTLGCKVNQFESEAIGQYLDNEDWTASEAGQETDVVIINTCTVTQKASMQSRQAIRQAIRAFPKARIIVTGCYVQQGFEDLKQIQGIHEIIGPALKHRIPQSVLSTMESSPSGTTRVIIPDISREQIFKQTPVTISQKRTRPFLKVQDGCNAFCTYCIVPHTRGRSRSMPAGDVIKKINQISSAGYQEVVLTGIHLGCYGKEFPNGTNSLIKLLERILIETDIARIRLSSIEPQELTRDIFGLVAGSKRFCNHFHIPLQSGDDGILAKMKRPYTGRMFHDLILNIHGALPDACIGVDTLIGFPGETDQAFDNTFQLIRDLPVTYLHVFPFSPRKGTPASNYPDPVPHPMIKERCRQMRDLGREKRISFLQSQMGKTVRVLIEETREKHTNLLRGMTSNYIPVLLDGPDNLRNRLVTAQITEPADEQSVFGILQPESRR